MHVCRHLLFKTGGYRREVVWLGNTVAGLLVGPGFPKMSYQIIAIDTHTQRKQVHSTVPLLSDQVDNCVAQCQPWHVFTFLLILAPVTGCAIIT